MTRTLQIHCCPKSCRLSCLVAFLLLGLFSTARDAQNATSLSDGTALYARVVRLAHQRQARLNGKFVVSVTAITGAHAEEDFYTGDADHGFHRFSTIDTPSFHGGLCCGTLYELPQAVGRLKQGTLLWAGSVGLSSITSPMRLEIYASRDSGASWRYLSDCARAKAPRAAGGGLWEPEFTFAADGSLVCFYSDETQPRHSQVIQQVRTRDGVHWSKPVSTVAVPNPAGRPGMPVVTRVPRGRYFMTYELCGTAACAVYSRTSTDGWHWGDPTADGKRVVTAEGGYLAHAPVNFWSPTGAPGGALLLVSQMVFGPTGEISAESGQVLWINENEDGSGPWQRVAAPVPVPEAFDNYCPNYSSPLLPTADGRSVLELASAYVGKTCRMFYATGPLAQ